MAISWDGSNWAAATLYALRARVVNGNSVYICITAGTSAGSGGPTGTSSNITDGAVHWAYLGAYTGCVLDVAPQLAGGTNPILAGAQAVFLTMAETRVADADLWGASFDDGRRYCAAHLGELARLRGHGPVTAEAVGPLSRSFASLISTSGGVYELTIAGRVYLDMVMSLETVFGFTG